MSVRQCVCILYLDTYYLVCMYMQYCNHEAAISMRVFCMCVCMCVCPRVCHAMHMYNGGLHYLYI